MLQRSKPHMRAHKDIEARTFSPCVPRRSRNVAPVAIDTPKVKERGEEIKTDHPILKHKDQYGPQIRRCSFQSCLLLIDDCRPQSICQVFAMAFRRQMDNHSMDTN